MKIKILFIIVLFFISCSLEKKRHKFLLNAKQEIFYHEIILTLQHYQRRIGKDPESIDDLVKFYESIYGKKKTYLWYTYFKDDLVVFKDCEEEMVIVYYIGPDGIDNKMTNLIQNRDFNYKEYKSLEGDIKLVGTQMVESCK